MAVGKIIKVNDVFSVEPEHGLVFGYAIVSKMRAADGTMVDYYDQNIDDKGDGTFEVVPENITEDAMFKAAVDVAQAGVQLPGNDEHQGPDIGSYYFMFPVTDEIAKALGWTVQKTGLVVGYKPANDEVLAKFKSGEYTGFSIEGARVSYQDIED